MIALTGPRTFSPPERSTHPQSIPRQVWLLPALLPVVIWFIKRLNDGSDEPLGLLALGLALLFAWRDRHSLETTPRA